MAIYLDWPLLIGSPDPEVASCCIINCEYNLIRPYFTCRINISTSDNKGVFTVTLICIDKAICNFYFQWEISYDTCDRDQWWCNRAQLYANEQWCDTVTTKDIAVWMWVQTKKKLNITELFCRTCLSNSSHAKCNFSLSIFW